MLQKSGLKTGDAELSRWLLGNGRTEKRVLAGISINSVVMLAVRFRVAVAEAAQQRGQGVHLSEGVVLFNGSMPGMFLLLLLLFLFLFRSRAKLVRTTCG